MMMMVKLPQMNHRFNETPIKIQPSHIAIQALRK